MGGSKKLERRPWRKARRRSLPAHWPGAALIAAVAVTDIAYRLLMREPLRRALGVQTRHA